MRTLSLIFCMTIAAFCVSGACAESSSIIRTHPGVFQSADGSLKVIVHPSRGFWARFGQSIPVQEFDPSQMPTAGLHLFIEYDAGQSRYTKVHVGSRSYDINGGLIIRAGRMRVALDNSNTNSGGYATIVFDNASVLALLGTNLVANSESMAPILEANQFNQYQQGVIEPYTLEAEGLFLKGKPLASRTVGLSLDLPKNSCTAASENVIFIPEDDVKRVRRETDEQARVSLLNRMLERNKGRNPLRSMIVFRVEKEPGSVFGLDYQTGYVLQLYRLASKSDSKIICVERKIPLA